MEDRDRYLNYIVGIGIADIKRMMESYGDDVWNYAYCLTKDTHLADDVAQETFIKAYRRFHTFRGEASLKGWLLKIARNTAFTLMNKAFLRRAVLLDFRSADNASSGLSQTSPSAENEAIAEETVNELWKTILNLPTKFRDPLILRYRHQLSVEEIAGVLGVSEGTVKSRIHRARKQAAQLLERSDYHA